MSDNESVESEKNVADATPTDLTKQLEELKQRNLDLEAINSDIIHSRDKAKAKAREFESAADKKVENELLEKEEFKTLYDDLNSKHTKLINTITKQDVDRALTKALETAGVTAIGTALKIIDTADIKLNDNGSIAEMQSIVDNLKENHAVLFLSDQPAPAPVVPSEDDVKNVVDIDFNTLDLTNPADRAKYAEYRKTHVL